MLVEMPKSVDPGKPISIAISAAAHAIFSRACKSRTVSRSMNDVASRLVLWFSKQTPLIQTAVISDIDRGMEHAYAEALRKLADEIEFGDARPIPKDKIVPLTELPPKRKPPDREREAG